MKVIFLVSVALLVACSAKEGAQKIGTSPSKSPEPGTPVGAAPHANAPAANVPESDAVTTPATDEDSGAAVEPGSGVGDPQGAPPVGSGTGEDLSSGNSDGGAPVGFTEHQQELFASIEHAVVTTETRALRLPAKLQLLPSLGGIGLSLADGATDYDRDLAKIEFYTQVSDTRSGNSKDFLETVNLILCLVSQTNYMDQADTGAYLSLVDEVKCQPAPAADAPKAPGQGEEEDAAPKAIEVSAPLYRNVTTDATRAANRPLVAKFWLGDYGGDVDAGEHAASQHPIRARIVVAEAPSDANRFGIFRLQWRLPSDEFWNGAGSLEVARDDDGRIIVRFDDHYSMEAQSFDEPGGDGAEAVTYSYPGYKSDTHIAVSGDEDAGAYRMVSRWSSGDEENTYGYDVAYDAALVSQKSTWGAEGAYSQCLSRGAVDRVAYGYSLYEASTGKRVELTTGFSIEATIGDVTYGGWASRDYVWLDTPEQSNVTNVVRVDYAENGERVTTPYSLFRSVGRISRHERLAKTLGDIKGEDLVVFSGSQDENDVYTGVATYVRWDGAQFQKFMVVTTIYGEESVETRAEASGSLAPSEDGYWSLYYPLLGASFFATAESVSDATAFSYERVTDVTGTEAEPSSDLVCFSRCPKMLPTAEQLESYEPATNAYYSVTIDDYVTNDRPSFEAPIATYHWNQTTKLLADADHAFAFPGGASESGRYLSSGELYLVADWNAMADKSGSSPLPAVYFTFDASTGSGYSELRDADDHRVEFDRPLSIEYTHAADKDLSGAASSPYYGKSFTLDYSGVGSLNGFPYDYETGNYGFGLAVGAHVTENFVALPRTVVEMPRSVAPEQCQTALPKAPAVSADAVLTVADIGDEPTGELKTLYIGGEPAGAN